MQGNAGGGTDNAASNSGGRMSKHLWLGNLNTKVPRSVLKAVFEHFGAVEDVVTFPGVTSRSLKWRDVCAQKTITDQGRNTGLPVAVATLYPFGNHSYCNLGQYFFNLKPLQVNYKLSPWGSCEGMPVLPGRKVLPGASPGHP
eukprot:scaffold41615_cov20-Tisochrysis_lutea.AAC.1